MKTKLIPFDAEKAKDGAKVVTRNGLPAKIVDYPVKNEDNPILGLVLIEGKEFPKLFTKNGNHYSDCTESRLDLFIEEEVEEDDSDYDPYKEAVESIMDMVERYSDADSDLQDFYDNVKVQCKDAVEYDKKWCKEQDKKTADNKPKFQKGDWVIDKQGMAQKITDVRENIIKHIYEYSTISYRFDILSYGYFSEIAKDIRLWTIQDVKDGDVLVCIGKSGQEIGIVKKYVGMYGDGDKCFETYCFVDWEGIFRLGGYYYMGSKEIYPATKEQRDFLFQKMKEAGYEWDSDKKELKKIEKVKTRRMTNQELADWLRDAPEEHRECRYRHNTTISPYLYYNLESANKEAKGLLVRRNHGEWEEPLIKE